MSKLQSTPAKHTRNNSSRFASTAEEPDKLKDDMDSEMVKHFVGPMPVEKFFEDFLPVQLPAGKRLPGFEEMATCAVENQMYESFVRLFFVPLLDSCL